jgi:hypothetical protein
MAEHHLVDQPHGQGVVRVRLCNHGGTRIKWPALRPAAVGCARCNDRTASAYPAPGPVPWWTALWRWLTEPLPP